MWQQVAGVTLAEVQRQTELWHWDTTALHVSFYPVDQESVVMAKRKGGKTRAAQVEAERVKERNVKEGKGKERTPAKSPTKSPTKSPARTPVSSPRFAPPTLDELTAYCQEKGFMWDATGFIDHYISNGWKVGGKTPMKDWKAAARNWERRKSDFGSNSRQQQLPQNAAPHWPAGYIAPETTDF